MIPNFQTSQRPHRTGCPGRICNLLYVVPAPRHQLRSTQPGSRLIGRPNHRPCRRNKIFTSRTVHWNATRIPLALSVLACCPFLPFWRSGFLVLLVWGGCFDSDNRRCESFCLPRAAVANGVSNCCPSSRHPRARTRHAPPACEGHPTKEGVRPHTRRPSAERVSRWTDKATSRRATAPAFVSRSFPTNRRTAAARLEVESTEYNILFFHSLENTSPNPPKPRQVRPVEPRPSGSKQGKKLLSVRCLLPFLRTRRSPRRFPFIYFYLYLF